MTIKVEDVDLTPPNPNQELIDIYQDYLSKLQKIEDRTLLDEFGTTVEEEIERISTHLGRISKKK